MPVNTDQQQATHLTDDDREFLHAVQDDVIRTHAHLRDDPALQDRLAMAYWEAKRKGLTQEALLAAFMLLEIDAPGFHRHPMIAGWLGEPGASIDERFADLLDVLRSKLGHASEEG